MNRREILVDIVCGKDDDDDDVRTVDPGFSSSGDEHMKSIRLRRDVPDRFPARYPKCTDRRAPDSNASGGCGLRVTAGIGLYQISEEWRTAHSTDQSSRRRRVWWCNVMHDVGETRARCVDKTRQQYA
jgi:hypothetical protein